MTDQSLRQVLYIMYCGAQLNIDASRPKISVNTFWVHFKLSFGCHLKGEILITVQALAREIMLTHGREMTFDTLSQIWHESYLPAPWQHVLKTVKATGQDINFLIIDFINFSALNN